MKANGVKDSERIKVGEITVNVSNVGKLADPDINYIRISLTNNQIQQIEKTLLVYRKKILSLVEERNRKINSFLTERLIK